MLILTCSVLVYTFNTHQPAVLGHNIEEIDWTEEINSPLDTAVLCINDTCHPGWLNLTLICGNCGLGSWWGEARSSSPYSTLIYPSCDTDNGWQPLTNFNKWSTVLTYSIGGTKNIASANSCCSLCYKYG